MHDVLEAHASFLKQFLHVLPHSQGLSFHIAHVDNLPLVVDGSCAGDVYVVAVAVLHEGGALEGDAILHCLVEVGGGIEVALLLGLEACQSVAAHLDDGLGVGRSAAYACGGDVVGVGCQSLLSEAFAA